MRLFRPGFLLKYLYPEAIFRLDTKEKVVCLTFDDGPDPGSTDQIMGILNNSGIKGVFFCSGKNCEKYPDLVRCLEENEHIIGNHGFNHIDGWKTSTAGYIDDISKASELIGSRLFRPPYGHVNRRQYKLLLKNFSIFFWDLMPYDFDKEFSKEDSLSVLKRKIRPGSIIVFHDTPAAVSKDILPDFIEYAQENGYRFVLPFRKPDFTF